MGQFDANPLPSSCSYFVLGTSRTKSIDDEQVLGCVHSYRGAKLLDLCDVINHHSNQKLKKVVVIAGFIHNRSSIDNFIEFSKFLIQHIIVKFSPNKLIVPKVIPTSCSRLINMNITDLNYAL